MLNLKANRSSPRFPTSNVASCRYLRPRALLLVGVAVAMACSGGCPGGAPDDAPGFLDDLSDGDPTSGNSGTADAGNGSDPGTAGDTQGNGLHVPDQQVFAMQGDSVEITLRLDDGADPDSDVRYAVVVAPAFGIITAGETREINTAALIYTPPADFAGNTAISYVARTNSGESNVATVSITVYPQVRFGVETLDERGLSVRCFAVTLGGDPLPDGTYVWRFDDVEDSGLMSTHSERTHTFADAGIHTISLTIILAGLQGPIACRSIDDSELQIRKHVTPRVSGRVRLSDGQPVAGVSVRAVDASFGDTTDEQGRYSFDVPLYWSGKVRAFREGYSFTPAFIEIGDVARDVHNAHFTASADTGSKAPVAYTQAVRTPRDTDVLITLTGSDPENDPLTYIVATIPAHGALFDAQRGYRIADGDLPYALASNLANYSPAPGYSGADVFRFRVSDGPNQSPDVDINIGVGQSNNAPLAHSQDVRVGEDRAVVVKLTGSDPDNDPLSFIIVELPTHGLLDDAQSNRRIGATDLPYVLSADSVRYTPQANYVGGDRFSFKVNDGNLDSPAAGVNLTVDGENDAPSIDQPDPFVLTVNKDSDPKDLPNQFELAATDVDADPVNPSLTWSIIPTNKTPHGWAQIEKGSPSKPGDSVTFSYKPDSGYTGSDTFDVRVSDDGGETAEITIAVDVVEQTPPNIYYVDGVKGDDAYEGTQVRPFKTIQRGVNATAAGDTVIIKAGTYREWVSLRGNINAKGQPGRPITIRSENWYPGAAHDRALVVIITGEATRQNVLSITSEQQYIVIAGLIIEKSANKNIVMGSGVQHITIEDCISRDAFVDGLNVAGSGPTVNDIIVRRCIFKENGNAGLQLRGVEGISNVLVEDCDSIRNGALVPENAQGFAARTPISNVLFRRCIAYGNLSSSVGAVDPVGLTIDGCVVWGTTSRGDAEGRSLVIGLHGLADGNIMRRSVSFDNPMAGVMLTNAPNTTMYDMTVFDNGFQRPDENPPSSRNGIAIDHSGLILRNVCTFDNAFDYYGNPDPGALDLDVGTVSNLDSDSNLIKDGRGLSHHGPNTLSGDPQLTDKLAARQLADDYEAGTVARRDFLSRLAGLLRPARGSPLIDAGAFSVFSASPGTNTATIPVDRDPRRFFRDGMPTIGVEADIIQIDDRDGDPQTMIRVRIVSMTANSITVETPVSFSTGAGIHVPYTGNAPDIGAFEAE